MVDITKTLDARNLSCPMPVLKSKKALKDIEIGQVLEILATDPGSINDMAAWTRTTGHELLSSEELGPKEFRFLVKKAK
jgi:TusA-related sulfurtransferase